MSMCRSEQIQKPPLRVLQILEATTGGTRRHLRHLLGNLDPGRFSLALIYSPLRDPHFIQDLAFYQQFGIVLHEVPMQREISPWHDFAALGRIMGIIRRGRFDVVHAHSSKAGFLGRLAARMLGVTGIVYTPHSFAFQYCPLGLRGSLYRWLERLAGLLHHQLVCVSEGERRVALQYRISPPERLRVIPNVVDKEQLHPSQSAHAIRNQLAIENHSLVIGMVAHFRPQKGYNHFIDAIPKILECCPRARFLIIGDGPLFEQVRLRIRRLGVEAAVILAGYQPHPPDYYQVMDIFVLSSLWEGMPYAILEAMAIGLPIIATNIGGNNELVEHGINGFLVPEMNSEQIASHVIHLIADPALRTRFGRASRRILGKMPGIKEWAGQYGELYEEMACFGRKKHMK